MLQNLDDISKVFEEIAKHGAQDSLKSLKNKVELLSNAMYSIDIHEHLPLEKKIMYLRQIAMCYYYLGLYIRKHDDRYESACWLRVEECLKQVIDNSDIDDSLLYYASGFGERGNMYRDEGNTKSAIALYERCITSCKDALEKYSSSPVYADLHRKTERILAVTCNNIGMEYSEIGDRKKALVYCKEALGILDKIDPTGVVASNVRQNIYDIENKAPVP